MSSSPPLLPPDQLAEYAGTPLLVVASVSLVTCIAFVFLRFYCRLWLRDAPIGWDDYLMAPAILFQVGMCILALIHVKYGLVGYHLERAAQILDGVPLDQQPSPESKYEAISRWGKVLFAIYFFWDWATVFSRLSVIALYLRIFSGKFIRYSCYFLGAFIIAYGLAFNLAAIFACTPVHYAWNKSINGHCFNIQLFFQLSTIPLITSDIPILLLPIPQVMKLEMMRHRKVGILLTFFTGGLGLVASCLRLAFFFSGTVLTDPTWDSARIILWTTVEPALYCIAACLVALRPFLSLIMPQKVRTYARNMINHHSGGNFAGARADKRAYTRDPALELGHWRHDGFRPDGFGPLKDNASSDPMTADVGTAAFADTSSLDDRIEAMTWPSREFQDAIHVKKEVWVSKSPFQPDS